MRRRGPDAEGMETLTTAAGRHVVLLHSRLSIIDLDARANQPFHDRGGTLSYNGEIYNYRELRAGLEKRGERFVTSSDTEILSRLLTLDGPGALAACEGMWAFAWWNAATSTLVLSRDRFGEKPLYVVEDGESLYFASEAKFIFALMGRRLPVDLVQIKRYLVNGYKSLYKVRDTFFRGMRELAPGSFAAWDANGRRHDRRYWVPTFGGPDDDMTYTQAVERAREVLMKSVELRLRADVPIAFCLSGGIDSNALIAIAKRSFGYDVHGFTIMNTDARYEERDMVETTVRELGLEHTAIPVETRDFLPRLRELVRYHDAPVYTITYYAQWRLMEAIRTAGYKVSVSGTGADEMFSGYYDHHNAYLAAVHDDRGRHAEALAEWRAHVAPLVRNPFLKDPDYFVSHPAGRDHIYLDAEGFSAFLREPWSEPFVEQSYTQPLLRNRMANELFHESVPVILHEDDLNAMYFSVENRSPYLDTALFDLSNLIPTRHLVRNGRAKAVLRDAVRGLAPDAVLDNPRKVGFNAPILDYLDVANNAVRSELLQDSPIFDLIDRAKMESLLDRAHLPNSQSKFLFNFVNSKIFLEEFAA